MANEKLLKVMEMPDGNSYIFNASQLDGNSYSDIMNAISAATNGAVVLKGTLGSGGTKTSLDAASSSNLGHAYKVITAGTYQSQAAKVGDLFICYKSGSSSYAWMLIPAGDDIEDTWRPIQVNGSDILANGTTSKALNLKAGSNVTISATKDDGTVTISSSYSDTGATSVETTGTGNAVTTASYDSSTRKITLTKGNTFVDLSSAQTITGLKTFSHSAFGAIVLTRSGSTNAASVIFKNSNGVLGSIGMTNAANSGLKRWSADTGSVYTIWDSGNDGSGSGLDADLLDGKHATSSLTATDDNNVPTSKAIADYINGLGYVTGSYLPLAGGDMKGPIDFEDKGNATGKNKNYISAGGGYGTASGKEGLKILALNQYNARMGLGVDLTMGGYELTVATGRASNDTASILAFATHTVDTTAYKRLGYFHASGAENPTVNFYVDGTIHENGTALSSKYLGINAKAADSDKLDGKDSSEFALKTEIPTVNDATLTIQKNGSNVATFTANASSNVTANIAVPTSISELTSHGNYNTTAGAGGCYYKITIIPRTSWMLAFTVRTYQGYEFVDYHISGYNYSASSPNYTWYDPSVFLIAGSDVGNKTVYFGHQNESQGSLRTMWVAIPAGDYTGLDIFDVTNGYTQVDKKDLFKIERIAISGNPSNLGGVTTNTITAYRQAFINEVPGSYSLPLAANGTRGGIQIGYSSTENNRAVNLSSEKAYIELPTRLKTSSGPGTGEAIADANDVKAQGWHYMNKTGTNRPPFKQSSEKDYRIMTTAYNDKWLQQIATDFRCNDMFIRRCEDGTWKPWTPIVRFQDCTSDHKMQTITDNAIARWDTSGTAMLQNSSVTIDDSNNLTIPGKLILGRTSQSAITDKTGISIHDLRSITPTPDMFGGYVANFYFDDQLNGWDSILHMEGWHTNSGGYHAWELAGPASTTAGRLYFRCGGGTTWDNTDKYTNGWRTIAFTDEMPSVSGTTGYIPKFTGTNSLGNSNLSIGTSGQLDISANSNTVSIGSQNSSWCHIYNSANISFIFNNNVCTTGGNLGDSTYKWGHLYLNGNIIKGNYTLTLPTKTGTVALTSDIPTIPTSLPANGGTSNAVASTGFGDGTFTYYQTSGDFYGNTGWCHYLISNHGNGSTYYNWTIGLPFWGGPIYKRQTGNTSTTSGWHSFVTSENIGNYYWANQALSTTSNDSTTPTLLGLYRPMSGTAFIGSSSYPFDNCYFGYCYSDNLVPRTTGTSYCGTLSTPYDYGYIDYCYVNSLRYYSNSSISLTPTSSGWKLPGSDTYGIIYPATTNYGKVGTSSYHFYHGWLNYIYTNVIRPVTTSGTSETSNTGSLGTSSYYFSEMNAYTIRFAATGSVSDRRLKENIEPTKINALNIIKQLIVSDFQYKAKIKKDKELKKQKEKALKALSQIPKTKETKELRQELNKIISTRNTEKEFEIGLIAQELEEILPNEYKKAFITKEDTIRNSGEYSIKFNSIIYTAIKAIQEQQEIIENQQQKIQSLEERLLKLESLILGDK